MFLLMARCEGNELKVLMDLLGFCREAEKEALKDEERKNAGPR